MKHKLMSTLRETIVNVAIEGDDVPTVKNARGYTFTPATVHALWVRNDSEPWTFVYVEMRGTFANGSPATSTKWTAVSELPEWLRSVVESTTPAEAVQERAL